MTGDTIRPAPTLGPVPVLDVVRAPGELGPSSSICAVWLWSGGRSRGCTCKQDAPQSGLAGWVGTGGCWTQVAGCTAATTTTTRPDAGMQDVVDNTDDTDDTEEGREMGGKCGGRARCKGWRCGPCGKGSSRGSDRPSVICPATSCICPRAHSPTGHSAWQAADARWCWSSRQARDRSARSQMPERLYMACSCSTRSQNRPPICAVQPAAMSAIHVSHPMSMRCADALWCSAWASWLVGAVQARPDLVATLADCATQQSVRHNRTVYWQTSDACMQLL
ncbi:hypothetical protein BC831DRAFT_197493 [Entophlyctis helioformis]|nr:hypothetical protein BC831DRAFT_197493 [Entophlyctis helioformis]